ncbi:hypothetical protein PHYBLDRAFT_73075 [Phycomyces blakesleeanus NRRL 1555(-)]|uniref:Uncharacterized protein n=1 Tax=Phycomyces blakesleeanus (strain ATCC 8743b / DSM 1359 / FGSC 10004 / NBRC 33097 / NRRL 1555) TaxID=763407 RepID=A0A167MF05_PHYB8|nr:hypothetical protein PHYBLDRAFT_73075 [Phycomyces blakesleeanus NRRL 1555(-)]OAD72666.1 hypothetical protein PHYBLDRAFT_73075 [Phycomyces blakesleeanus NRRL 1555(-)]|eukprot:XP_018290706.1 hypothetical protein PHYBLDRAFT_73075 [Phycomyces blakesleeanus NRRL 1555(-)]
MTNVGKEEKSRNEERKRYNFFSTFETKYQKAYPINDSKRKLKRGDQLRPKKIMPTSNHKLAYSLASTDVQLLQALNAMKEEMKAMKDKITLIDTQIDVVITGNTTSINGIDTLSALPAPVNVPTIVAPTSAALPTTESGDTNTVFGYIHGYMWSPKLKSRDQAEIQVNAIKSKWAVDICFDHSPNRELVKQILYYLEKMFAGTDMRIYDLRKCVYTNFCIRHCQQRELPETRRALNTNSRRSGHETDADIDLKMSQNCSGLIQKLVMSEGESDYDMSPSQPRNEICVARPSWRKVDLFVVKQLGANSFQLLRRVYDRTVESTVPINLDPALPQWALRNES